MAAPFLPEGYAVSETSNAVGAGTRSFTLLEENYTNLPDGYIVQAEAEVDVDQWMIGAWERLSATTGKLHMLGTTSGVDYVGSDTFDRWRLKVCDYPRKGIPVGQINGLRISITGNSTISVSAGSRRDHTNAVDLVLDEAIEKDLSSAFAVGDGNGAYVQSALLTGTVTDAGAAVITGTSTTFTTDYASLESKALTNGFDVTVLQDRYGLMITNSIIAPTGGSVAMIFVSDNTTATSSPGSTYTGATHKRGGWVGSGANYIPYAIELIRRDSDGAIDISQSALTAGGTPDLPSGWTYYGIIGVAVSLGGVLVDVFHTPDANFIEDLEAHARQLPWIPKALINVTITPTALGINASAIDQANDLATFTAHGCTTGEWVVLTGTVVTTLVTGQPYYINAANANQLSFHLTLADALAGTNKVNLSAATTGWSFRRMIYSNQFPDDGFTGLSSISPIAGVTGTTTLGLELNLDPPLGSANCLAEWGGRNLTVSTPATAVSWSQPVASSKATNLVKFSDLRPLGSTAGPGTWAQQGTTAFEVSGKVWGEAA